MQRLARENHRAVLVISDLAVVRVILVRPAVISVLFGICIPLMCIIA